MESATLSQKGPDGRQYAVGGEVGISMPSGDTPEESLQIARQVERAANAPADPSSADRAIAAAARAKTAEAMRQMSAEAPEEAESSDDTPPLSAEVKEKSEIRPENDDVDGQLAESFSSLIDLIEGLNPKGSDEPERQLGDFADAAVDAEDPLQSLFGLVKSL